MRTTLAVVVAAVALWFSDAIGTAVGAVLGFFTGIVYAVIQFAMH